jgi:hypothetical protein
MVVAVPELPAEVLDHVRAVFAECRRSAAAKMSRMPTTHETALDLSIIECVSALGVPVRADKRWVVRIDAHYLGGGRHFGEWEVADLGLIIVIRDRGAVRLRKVALLQSKRLYPNEQNLEEDTPLDYEIGFARMMPEDVSALEAEEVRHFTFTEDSQYRALDVRDHQYLTIEDYEAQYGIPVQYLLHHPLTIPCEQTIPIPSSSDIESQECEVGPSVIRAQTLRDALAGQVDGYHPSYSDFSRSQTWPLDQFVADELLRCREGYIAQGPQDDGLYRVFNRRSGPIAAAISITIDRIGD